jgi:hypothetical protein
MRLSMVVSVAKRKVVGRAAFCASLSNAMLGDLWCLFFALTLPLLAFDTSTLPLTTYTLPQ